MQSFQPDQIIRETSQYIVVYKPAGIAVQSGSVGSMDLEHQLLGYLASRNNVKSIPYLGVIHRLDQPVEGILLFAKTRKAAADFSAQIRNGSMNKEYLAIVEGIPEKKEALLTDYLLRDGKKNLSSVVPEHTEGAKKAQLQYTVLDTDDSGHTLLLIHLMTGRHHQIRVQLSHAGLPISGDSRYGYDTAQKSSEKNDTGSAHGRQELLLCASSLTFREPESGRVRTITITPKALRFQDFKKVTI